LRMLMGFLWPAAAAAGVASRDDGDKPGFVP